MLPEALETGKAKFLSELSRERRNGGIQFGHFVARTPLGRSSSPQSRSLGIRASKNADDAKAFERLSRDQKCACAQTGDTRGHRPLNHVSDVRCVAVRQRSMRSVARCHHVVLWRSM